MNLARLFQAIQTTMEIVSFPLSVSAYFFPVLTNIKCCSMFVLSSLCPPHVILFILCLSSSNMRFFFYCVVFSSFRGFLFLFPGISGETHPDLILLILWKELKANKRDKNFKSHRVRRTFYRKSFESFWDKLSPPGKSLSWNYKSLWNMHLEL